MVFDRCVRVEAVDLVQVDVVGAEAGQRGVDLLHDRLARESGSAWAVMHLEEHLGGEDDLVSAGVLLQCSPDDLFRAADAVNIGGIPEGDAEFDGLLEERLRLIVAEGPFAESARGVSEAHTAERDPADLEARAA
jgi:hypothetical protein